MRDYIKEKYISKVNETELDDTTLEVSPLQWWVLLEYGKIFTIVWFGV